MFFEDEKDFIGNPADIRIDEDGTVSWESVLAQSDEDGIVSLKSDNADSLSHSTQIDEELINLGDELELVNEDSDGINEDKQLNEILSNTTSSNIDEEQTDYTNTQVDEDDSSEFDIDKQLAAVAAQQAKGDSEEIKPRKNENAKNSSKSSMPLLIFVLFIALVGGGFYYINEYGFSLNVNENNLPVTQTIADEMNNIKKEDIIQRKQENIPVVNDEEAQKVEPQEEEDKKEEVAQEKKEVIDVKPAGRINPFLPTSKYATSELPEMTVDFDSAGIPKPPEEYGMKEDTIKLLSISVSGIMYDNIKPCAIITFEDNDYFVQVGDRLDDFKIVEIEKTHVSISLDNNIYKANIGEEFKIVEAGGSAKYLPDKEGGGRQYTSVNKINESEKVQSRRYVSEEDIKIKTR